MRTGGVFHWFPERFRKSLWLYCPVHQDQQVTRLEHDMCCHAEGQSGFFKTMCEKCINDLIAMKRGIRDGCRTQTERLRRREGNG